MKPSVLLFRSTEFNSVPGVGHLYRSHLGVTTLRVAVPTSFVGSAGGSTMCGITVRPTS
jgi:hypothetical protein